MRKIFLLLLLFPVFVLAGTPNIKIQIDLDGDGVVDIEQIIPLVKPEPAPPPDPIPVPTPDPTPPPVPVPEPHPDPAPPPGPIPASITIHHGDVIPILGRDYTDSIVQNGPWNAPQTWADGTVPTAQDKVFIQYGATCSIESLDSIADTVIVGGRLTFSSIRATKLAFTTLTVLPTADLIIGNDQAPIMGSAELVVRDVPVNLAVDPQRYGTGILIFGNFVACGMPKTSYVRLSAELSPNVTAVSLAQPVDGWAVGDKLELPDTRQLNFNERDGVFASYPSPFTTAPVFKNVQWEEFTLKSISPDRKTVVLSSPTKFVHKGARDVDGNLEVLPHLANLTRNITIHSENPTSAWTGHILATDRAYVYLRNVSVREMGRTTNADLGGANVIGRYPLHMHGLMGPQNIAPGLDQFLIQGCVIDGGSASHNRKWGIVIHGSHWGMVRDNVVCNAMGAGIMAEDGTETEDVIEQNYVTRVFGKGGRADGMFDVSKGTGREGSGIYCRGPFLRVRDNVCSNVYSIQPYAYGYTLSYVFLGKINIPISPGSDVTKIVDANAAGQMLEFSNNETYASRGGMTIWWAGSFGNVADPGPNPTIIKNFRSWHCYEFGSLFQYELSNCIFDGLWCRGDLAVTKSGNGAGVFYGMDYPAPGLIIRNADIQGQAWAWQCSTYCGADQTQTIENSFIRCRLGMYTPTPWSSASSAKNLPKNHVIVKNCKFMPLPGEALKAIDRVYAIPNPGARATNYIIDDVLEVQAYQGNPSDNFFVYYTQQDPNSIVPQSNGTIIGIPESGLSNSAAFAKYGLCIGGKIAPCATKRPEIGGFVCPN